MRNIRHSVLTALLVIAGGQMGCNGGAPVPPPAAPAAAPAPGGLAGAVAGGAAPMGGAPGGGAVVGAGPMAPGGVDPQIQQRLITLAPTLSQDQDEGGVTRNDIRQIGLAFHNYHDTYSGFPALNGPGQPGIPNPGLSWRVMLLPYVEQSALFEKFHLNEPWDSEHNKTLIAQMPAIYGKSNDGKSQVHLLTGNGAPFQNDKRLSISEITDGTSNTIMALVGGADTAEIWTKPGGREFDPKQPLQSLGNVDDKFQVVMMDGASLKLPKTISGDQLASLVQHQDGIAVDLGAISQGGRATAGDAGPEIKIHAPTEPLAPAAGKTDLRFIPGDAFLSLVLHPRRAYMHPVIQKVRELLPADPNGPGAGLPPDLQMPIQQISGLRSELGIALEHVDDVVVVLDKSLPEALMNNPFGAPHFGLLIRNSAPLDIDGIITRLTRSSEGISIVEHEGVALILAPGTSRSPAAPPMPGAPAQPSDRISAAFISNSVAVLGNEYIVRKMISARTATAATTDLTRQLEGLGNPLIALAVDAAPVEKALKTAVKDAPPQFAIFTPYLVGARTVNLTLDLDAKDFLNLAVTFKTPELASGLFGLLDGQYKGMKEQYPLVRGAAGKDPASLQAVEYADQIVAETTFTNTAETISLVIPKIKNLEKLPDALKPAIEGANKAANSATQKNHLKQVGLAFHNFHSAFTHLPALNGKGEKGETNPGLSWRVYILPFMDEATLYNKFKLDEPWDSPTNMALIKEMPKVFGTDPEGKTSIHVFTGPGAPFQTTEGLGFFAITDGLSNTFLAVETGPDTADIWTKPTGLIFDPADPFKCLGKITEFQALMFDGSVRTIKNLDAANFAKLVQVADGKPVELP